MRLDGSADAGRPGALDEAAIIERFFRRPSARDDVLLGIGDDAALLAPPAGQALAVAVDTLVEGTHFHLGTDPRALGHRVLAVNLSDLAAMGAEPAWCLLSLSLPRPDPAWLAGFADGFFALADRHGVALVGGDTVRGPLAATVTVHGFVPAAQACRRSGARPGDGIWVTGTPGDAVAGRLAQADGADAGDPALAALLARFLYPEPRVAAGLALRGLASAMIDVSDGLHQDLARLLVASGAGGELVVEALPLSAALTARAGGEAAALALTGGDDYELCFTLPEHHAGQLVERARAWDFPVTRIGTVTAGSGLTLLRAGQPCALPPGSYRHF